jgi:hypothetical protein
MVVVRPTVRPKGKGYERKGQKEKKKKEKEKGKEIHFWLAKHNH